MNLSSNRYYKAVYPYFWFIPLFIIIGFTLIYPWVWSFILSFTRFSISEGAPPRFVGLENYLKTLTDPLFHLSLLKTFLYILMTVPAQLVIGFGVALLLNQNVKGRGVLMAGIMLPFMLTPAIVGLIWKILLSGHWGVLNYFLGLVGIPKIGWLSNPDFTMLTVSFIDVWQHAPWVMLVLYAGLQSIPRDIYEAAEIDGASSWQTFINITLPYLKPLLVIVVMFRLMFALRSFDVIYTLFRSGGPGNSVMLLGVHLYEKFSLTWEVGQTAALSYIFLALTMLLSLGLTVRMYKEVE